MEFFGTQNCNSSIDPPSFEYLIYYYAREYVVGERGIFADESSGIGG